MSRGNLCLNCQNAVPCRDRGCSWSRAFIPVEGWTARPTLYLSYAAHGRRILMRSFAVRRCPEFRPDDPRRTLATAPKGCYTGK